MHLRIDVIKRTFDQRRIGIFAGVEQRQGCQRGDVADLSELGPTSVTAALVFEKTDALSDRLPNGFRRNIFDG